jgi:hypothetical protein
MEAVLAVAPWVVLQLIGLFYLLWYCPRSQGKLCTYTATGAFTGNSAAKVANLHKTKAVFPLAKFSEITPVIVTRDSDSYSHQTT